MTKPAWFITALVLGILLGFLWGIQEGWLARIQYEVLQCADYGRCFNH